MPGRHKRRCNAAIHTFTYGSCARRIRKARDYHEVQIGDVTMILERISDSESKIVKLISTNPNDFLNPTLQPGKIVSATLFLDKNSYL